MRAERLINLGLALAAVLVAVVLFHPGGDPTRKQSKPSSVDTGENGYSALAAWLSARGVDWASFRRPLTELASRHPSGNVLLASGGTFYASSHVEDLAVVRWVAAGNTLVLVTDCNCGCGSAMAILEDFGFRESRLGEAKPASAPVPEPGSEPARRLVRALPGEAHPLNRGILALAQRELAELARCGHDFGFFEDARQWDEDEDAIEDWEAEEDEEADEAEPGSPGEKTSSGTGSACPAPQAGIPDPSRAPPMLPLFVSAPENGFSGPLAWYEPFGHGHVVVVGLGGIFGNANLARGDNARFLELLVTALRRGDGLLLFADYHQGLSELYDAATLFADSRTHQSLLALFAFWLVYATLRWQRLVRPLPPRPRGRPQALTEGAAALYARELPPQEAAGALFQALLTDLMRRAALPDREQALARLQVLPLPAADRARLLAPEAVQTLDDLKRYAELLHAVGPRLEPDSTAR